MGGTGRAGTGRSLALVGLVAGVIVLGSLAAVGLLPGQATTLPEPARALPTTTVPRAASTSVPPTTTVPLSTSTTSSATTTTEATGESATASTTAPAVASGTGSGSGQGPGAVTTSTPDTAAAPGAEIEPTCEVLQELLALIEDPTVRALVSNEFGSVCAG